MLIGYMRVSTAEQNVALQRDALEGVSCEKLYEDTCSGAVTDRPGLAKAFDQLRAGAARLPRVDLPELLLEMYARTGFAGGFTHASEGGARAGGVATSIWAVFAGGRATPGSSR